MRVALLSVFAVLLLTSCSSQAPESTNPRAAMSRATFDPGRCEQIGPNVYNCNSEHADPTQAMGMHQAGATNDARAIRGTCADGYQYVQGQGCMPAD
jgi:hypothetical protein